MKFGIHLGGGFDPTEPTFIEDPYPSYKVLRESDPVHYLRSAKAWWLTRYSDVVATLTDRRFGKQGGPVVKNRLFQGMFFRDPPDHTRLRSLVSKAFTPATAESLRPRIVQIVEERLRLREEKETLDLMQEFAFPIPATIIAEMLGVPPDDYDRFRGLSDRIVKGMDLSRPDAVRRDGMAAFSELETYFAMLIEKRRVSKGRDLLSGLILAEEKGERLTPEELLSTCVILLVAGLETTANLIGNGTFALLSHPQELQILRNHPEMIARAVEELLRYDGPFQRVQRIAHEDVTIRGKVVRKGEKVFCVLGSANHDPEVFRDADQLVLSRAENPHVAFGRGIHLCLGAPLARVEAQVAFQLLLRESPNLALAGNPIWKADTAMRGLEKLVVAI